MNKCKLYPICPVPKILKLYHSHWNLIHSSMAALLIWRKLIIWVGNWMVWHSLGSIVFFSNICRAVEKVTSDHARLLEAHCLEAQVCAPKQTELCFGTHTPWHLDGYCCYLRCWGSRSQSEQVSSWTIRVSQSNQDNSWYYIQPLDVLYKQCLNMNRLSIPVVLGGTEDRQSRVAVLNPPSQ